MDISKILKELNIKKENYRVQGFEYLVDANTNMAQIFKKIEDDMQELIVLVSEEEKSNNG